MRYNFLLSICLLGVLFFTGKSVLAQASGDYRSNNATMNWNTATDWETFNGSTWVTAGASPTSSNGAIEVRAGHHVTITATVTLDQVTVNGTVTINSGVTLNLTNIVSPATKLTVESGGVLNVNGTINQSGINGQRKVIVCNGTLNLNDNATYNGGADRNIFNNGSVFNYDCTTTTGSIPLATWNTGSTCVIRGITTGGVPGNLGQTFHHFTWDLQSLDLGDYLYLDGLPATVNGDYSILNTNTSVTSSGLALLNASGPQIINVGGDFVVSGDTYLALSIDGTDACTLNVTGDFILNDANSSIDLAQDGISTLNLLGNLILSAGGIFNSVNSNCELNFNGTTAQTVTHAGSIVSGTWNVSLGSGSTINIPAGHFVGGTGWIGTFDASAGTGTIQAGSTNSTGAIVSSSTSLGAIRFSSQTYNATTTIEYNGVSPQFMGSGNPGSVNYTINNASGVTLNANWTLTSSNTLTFTSGKLSIGARTLTINGTVSGMSAANSFTGSSSSNISIGSTTSSAGTLFFDQTTDGTSNMINNFTLNRSGGSVTIGNKLVMNSLLTVTSGELLTGGFITLRSTSAGTAQVGAVTGTITGNVTAERFIPSVGRAYRFLASPVSGVSFASSWQQATHITGDGGAANGFDATPSNNPSCFLYDESPSGSNNTGWTSISNTGSTNLTVKRGYRMFIRGSRTAGKLDGSDLTQDAITLSATGTLAAGDQTFNTTGSVLTCSNGCGSNNDGWNLVGNPFQATIDWNAVSRTNVDNAVYIFNPATNSYSEYVGGVGTNGGSQYISPGQAFFVRANTASPSFTIQQIDKATSFRNDIFKAGTILPDLLRVQLTDNTLNKITSDMVVRYTDSASLGFDSEYDAYKLSATGTGNISSFDQLAYYAINARPASLLNGIDTIPFRVSLPAAAGTYKLIFEGASSFGTGQFIYLKDKFANTLTDLNLNNEYSFSTTTSAASVSTGRFVLMFSNSSQSLPVKFANISAVKEGKFAVINWETVTEINNDYFEVERSADGASFEYIGTVKGAGNSLKVNKYLFADNNELNIGYTYYRIKQVDFNGKYTYSKTVFITDGNEEHVSLKTDLTIYPIPATRELTISDKLANGTQISITDTYGKLVNITEASGLVEQTINIETLKTGVYILEVVTADGKTVRTKFIKE